ncbi:MAG: SH3 domain-containing protein [Lachnospiraceae bacterium]|nr:SH3 domain-containing protein [Lachnospiraceae bacterium]
MNQFREWLSDNLRYILLIIGVLGVLMGLFFGVRAVSIGLGRTDSTDAGNVRLTADETQNGGVTVSVIEKPADTLTADELKPGASLTESGSTDSQTADSKAASAGSDAETDSKAEQTESADTAADDQALPTIPGTVNPDKQETSSEESNTADEDADLDQPTEETGSQPASEDKNDDQDGESASSYGTVTDTVYVRTGPGVDNTQIGTVDPGTVVTILGIEDGWYHVQTEEFGEGYIGPRYMKEISDPSEAQAVAEAAGAAAGDAEDAQEESYERTGVIKSAVSLRSGPGFDYEVIGQLSGGTTVTAIENVKGWWHVYTDIGEGYVGQSYITVS